MLGTPLGMTLKALDRVFDNVIEWLDDVQQRWMIDSLMPILFMLLPSPTGTSPSCSFTISNGDTLPMLGKWQLTFPSNTLAPHHQHLHPVHHKLSFKFRILYYRSLGHQSSSILLMYLMSLVVIMIFELKHMHALMLKAHFNCQILGLAHRLFQAQLVYQTMHFPIGRL